MASNLCEFRHITFFTFHLDIFEGHPYVSVRSFRRLSEHSFNITVVIHIPVSIMINDKNDVDCKRISEEVENIYTAYVKSPRFNRETYEKTNQHVHEFLVKYPHL